ncbi:transcriptional regulator, AsnC family [Colwellia chukchiensis]|uniref:siroheme decarboxylase n=1 Tax=Colwellia chukchiensis TaxID=641665 RepID=A0A1H7M2I9_9GAMM|nr:Lrp/AsnC family transcriptional regulator [Colwellia chukchiensis]SEL04935.1 transcriptional regulator, AsnC family [Colwellia chukchiensis]
MSLILTELQQNIINAYQKGFPLVARPYQVLAEQFNSSEAQVLAAIRQLDEAGALSRVGAVFNHKKAGASTLAALAVPAAELDRVAEIVNQFDEVNHNYEREHSYNLWFVVTAYDENALAQVLTKISELTGLPVLKLPMEAAYHIDLAFSINFATPSFSTSTAHAQISQGH